MGHLLSLDQKRGQLEPDEVPDPHDRRVELVFAGHEARIVTQSYQADADLGHVRGDSLRRNLVGLKSLQLEGLLCDFVDAAVSALSLDVDVNVHW
jgi:hypothetical protein